MCPRARLLPRKQYIGVTKPRMSSCWFVIRPNANWCSTTRTEITIRTGPQSPEARARTRGQTRELRDGGLCGSSPEAPAVKDVVSRPTRRPSGRRHDFEASLAEELGEQIRVLQGLDPVSPLQRATRLLHRRLAAHHLRPEHP